MKHPNTYLEWSIILEEFGSGNNEKLAEMEKGSFDADAGTASRFFNQIEKTYRKRKEQWLNSFTRSISINNIKSINDFELIIRGTNKKLIPIKNFIHLSSLPEDVKKILQEDFEKFLKEAKESLKDSSPRLSNQREKFLLILKSFGNIKSSDIPKKNNLGSNNNSGRKIIF